MFGQMPMPGSGMGSPMPAPIPNSPSVPPASINTPSPAAAGAGPNFLTDLFGALFDPDTAALKMAEAGMSPEDFTARLKSENLANAMKPRTGKPPSSLFGNKSLTDRGLYESIIKPQEAGKAGDKDLSKLIAGPSIPPRTNDVISPNGTRIVQPGPDHPDISAATGDEFIGGGDILSKLMSGAKGGDAQLRMPSMLKPTGQSQPPLFPDVMSAGDAMPVAPPVPQQPLPSGAQNVPPIVPPVLPQSPIVPETIVGTNFTPSIRVGDAPTQSPLAATSDMNTGGSSNSTVLGGAGGGPLNLSGNRIFTGFMDTVHAGGLTNPNGLAAVAATGKSESAFDPKNAYGSWNDPSEKGVAGTSGGIMSWRAARFDAMRKFVKDNGGDPSSPSPELQAKFFLQENPALIKKLQNAKSPEEAQKYMNEAWQFAGWDKPGGEAGRRISLARNLVSTFGGQGGDGGVGGSGIGAGESAGVGMGKGMGGIGVGGVGGGETAAATPSLLDRLAALSESEGDSKGSDYHGPTPPDAVPPRPGQFNASAEIMKLILAMFASGGSSNAVPTISQVMAGKTQPQSG